MRAVAVVVDLCAVIAAGVAFAWMLQTDITLSCALVGFGYYALATLTVGRSVALWWVDRRVLQRTRSTRHERVMVLVPRRRPGDAQWDSSAIDFDEGPSPSIPRAASR
jgi:hypothetical protein